MLNPAPYVRKSFYNLLNGAILYDNGPVPVYDTEGKGEAYQILIVEQTNQENSTRNNFSGTFQQLLEIVTEDKGYAARRKADEIGGLVMDMIQPTPGGHQLSSTEFQILNLKRLSQNYIIEEGANGSKIVRLLIRYQFFINQLNN